MKIRISNNGFQWVLLAMTGLTAGSVVAVPIDVGPDWTVNLDTTVQYNLGFRAEGMNDKIGNNPSYSENNYKFDKAGDIVTNRLSLLPELDAEYAADFGSAGFRVSGSIFRDFAYDDDVENHPGEAAPGVSYSNLGSYKGNKYSSYTKRYYVRGGQLLDAFIFANFRAFEKPTSVRVGRFTSYWGNAMFSNYAGIAYSQNAVDNIKGASAPGTEAKELAIPRGQAMISTQFADDWTLEAQHFFEFEGNRLPEGGTYLGIVGGLFNGPDFLGGPGGLPQGKEHEPSDINSNYGVRLSYQPYWLRGTLSAIYRRFDETQPWAPLLATDVNGVPTSYRLAYAQKVDMFGLSLEKQLGDFSTGFEVSYRKNTALGSAGALVNDRGREGARGDTLNIVANAITGLTGTDFYDTGTAMAELGFTKRLKTTENKELYNSTSNRAVCPSGSKWDGCATDESLVFSALVEPQWLNVFPGVDLSMPAFVQYGVYGNTPSLGAGVNQGALIYTLGVRAIIDRNYNITLQYNGYNAHHRSQLTNASNGAVPVGTDGYPSYYASGNGTYFYNDKDWISLTAKFSF